MIKHLHKFKQVVKTPECVVEVCERCKVKTYYRKDTNGRMDTKRYYKDHERDFLQPNNPKYKQEYEN